MPRLLPSLLPRLLVRLLTVLSLTLGVLALSGTATAVRDRTFTPKPLPWSAPDLPNSLRGLYAWLGADGPQGWATPDVYYRDQVYWGRIEPTDGAYDFSWFEAGLADAEARGGRFGFRVMSYCPGCWMNFRDDLPDVTPSFVPLQPGTDIPDWNSEAFLTGWEQLMADLGARYGDDPRLGWVDVGGYGSYGEWHVAEGKELTPANAERLTAAVLAAFPRAHVVVNAMDPELTYAALDTSRRVGLRADCLGEDDMFSLIPTSPRLQTVWKRAPVIGEWCATPTTSPVLGARQVTRYHVSQISSGNLEVGYDDMSATARAGWRDAVKHSGYRYALRELTLARKLRAGSTAKVRSTWRNLGSAPTYDAWQVRLEFRTGDGSIAGYAPLPLDLRKVLPGTRTHRAQITVPALPRGRYTLAVSVASTGGYLDPMALALKARSGSGYVLGKVTVR